MSGEGPQHRHADFIWHRPCPPPPLCHALILDKRFSRSGSVPLKDSDSHGTLFAWLYLSALHCSQFLTHHTLNGPLGCETLNLQPIDPQRCITKKFHVPPSQFLIYISTEMQGKNPAGSTRPTVYLCLVLLSHIPRNAKVLFTEYHGFTPTVQTAVRFEPDRLRQPGGSGLAGYCFLLNLEGRSKFAGNKAEAITTGNVINVNTFYIDPVQWRNGLESTLQMLVGKHWSFVVIWHFNVQVFLLSTLPLLKR